MHYRESFFRDPFFADCWSVLDKSAKISEKHRTSSRTTSTSSDDGGKESPTPSVDPAVKGLSKIVNDNDKFQVFVEVENFLPEELTVKTVDHYIIVEGKHEEKEDPHGFISRQFTRKYLLPIDTKPENVTCNLSTDGILLISVPRENIDLLPLKETIIEIEKTDKNLRDLKEKDDSSNPTAAA